MNLNQSSLWNPTDIGSCRRTKCQKFQEIRISIAVMGMSDDVTNIHGYHDFI